MTLFPIAMALNQAARVLPLPDAVVYVRKGDASESRPGKRAVKFLERFSPQVGDVVHVGTDSQATLAFRSTGRLYRLSAGISVKVGKGMAAGLNGSPIPFDRVPTAPADQSRDKRLSLSTTVRGGDLELTPKGAIRRGPLRLAWSAPAATSVEIELRPLDGVVRLTKKLSADAQGFDMPPALLSQLGWCRVHITVGYDRSPLGNAYTVTRVLSDPERKRLEACEAGLATKRAALGNSYDWARAELLAACGLVGEMVQAWQSGLAALKMQKNSAPSQRALGEFYELAGFRSEARTAYERARIAGANDEDLTEAIRRMDDSP